MVRCELSRSRPWRLAATVLLGLGCGHCQADSSSVTADDTDNIAFWAIVVQPEDLATDMAEREVALIVLPALDSTHKAPVSLLEQVAAAVSVHDANGVAVPITTEVLASRIVEPTSFDDPVDLTANGAIQVKGHEPWSQTWHTLRLDDLPERFEMLGFRPPREGDTAYEMRFTPAPIAILQNLLYCPGTDSSGTLAAQFSHRIDWETESQQIRVTTHEGGQACTVRPTSAQPSVPAGIIFFDCVPELTDFTLAVDSPLVAVDGKQVTLLDGPTTFAIAWPSDSWLRAQKQGPDCVLWQE